MTRTEQLKALEKLIGDRNYNLRIQAMWRRMERADRKEGREALAAQDATNAAKSQTLIDQIDAEINAIAFALVAPPMAPALPVFHRRSPATATEPAEEWHEIECPKCADWFAVNYAPGVETIRCGGCDTLYTATIPVTYTLDVETVNQVLIENLPGTAGLKFLGTQPR